MAKQGDEIANARTGQKMIFLQTGKETNGQLLEIESFNPKSVMREPIHVHPKQESAAKVISGKLHFMVNGKEQIIGPGENINIPAGAPHCFWNEDDTEAHSVQQFSPALHIDAFFESYFSLANDGKLSDKGMPPFLQLPLMGLKHKNEIRVTNPPWPLQLLTYWILAPISFLMGYKDSYYSKNDAPIILRLTPVVTDKVQATFGLTLFVRIAEQPLTRVLAIWRLNEYILIDILLLSDISI